MEWKSTHKHNYYYEHMNKYTHTHVFSVQNENTKCFHTQKSHTFETEEMFFGAIFNFSAHNFRVSIRNYELLPYTYSSWFIQTREKCCWVFYSMKRTLVLHFIIWINQIMYYSSRFRNRTLVCERLWLVCCRWCCFFSHWNHLQITLCTVLGYC